MLVGVPHVGRSSGVGHVLGQGPGGRGSRATGQDIDGSRLAQYIGVVPSKSNVFANSVQNGTGAGRDRLSNCNGSDGRILWVFGVVRFSRLGTLAGLRRIGLGGVEIGLRGVAILFVAVFVVLVVVAGFRGLSASASLGRFSSGR